MKILLQQGYCFFICNDEDVLIWRDPWIPSIPGFKPSPNSAPYDLEVFIVADLIDPDTGQWNHSLLWSILLLNMRLTSLKFI